MTDAEALAEKLKLLRAHYCRQLPQRVAELEAVLYQAGEEAKAALLRYAHQLYGTAGSYGFADISDAARQLEDALRDGSAQDTVTRLTHALLEACKSHMQQAESVVKEEGETGLPLVVVIDDDPMIVMLLRKLLQADARVQGGGSLEAVLPYLSQSPVVILLDNQLEHRVDGLTVLRLLRADALYRAIPVVMITANESADVKERALAEGAEGYLSKPLVLPDAIDYLRAQFLQKN